MKFDSITSRNRALLAGALLCTVGLGVSQAQPYYVAGSGLTPSWAPGATNNEMTGGPTVYTLTTATTPTITNGANLYHEFKITGASWSNPSYPGNNVRTKPDANGSNTFNFFPGISADGWSPAQDRVGYADPGGLSFEIAGDFNGWNGGTGYQLNPIGNGVYSNSIVVPTAGTYGFKFRTPGSWNDIYFGADFGNNGGNASLTTTTSPQTVQMLLDLPNGRWLAGAVTQPVTNQVVFAVDMSSQISVGNFNPASDAVFVSGNFNGWAGTGANALVLTNVPTFAGNTNIYYGTNLFVGSPNSQGSQYKFTSSAAAYSGSSGYEPRSANRTFNLLSTSGVELLPVVSFGDVYTSDYLSEDVQVTFTIDLANATTSTNSSSAINSPPGYTAHTFDPSSDRVFVNGNFLSGGWAGWDPISMSAYQVTNNPPGSTIYQFTSLVPKGSSVKLDYKYGMYYASNPSTNYIMDNEAPAYQDHIRYIRVTSTGSYNLPTDTFGNQHVEPSIGQVAIAPGTAGNLKVTWLGRPGAHVQTTTNLAGTSWVDHFETDGTNWTTGTTSPDGFLSATNWPNTGGNQFFRLIQQ